MSKGMGKKRSSKKMASPEKRAIKKEREEDD